MMEYSQDQLVIFLEELYQDHHLNEVLLTDYISHLALEGIKKKANKKKIVTAFDLLARLNSLIIAHFDPEDYYRISNFRSSQLIYIQRLSFILHRCLDGDVDSIRTYEDELGKLT